MPTSAVLSYKAALAVGIGIIFSSSFAVAENGVTVRSSKGMYYRQHPDGTIKTLGRVGGGSGTRYPAPPKADPRTARVNGRVVTGYSVGRDGRLTAHTGSGTGSRVGHYDPTRGDPHVGKTPIPHFHGSPLAASRSALSRLAPKQLPAGTYTVLVRNYMRSGDSPFYRAIGGKKGTIKADGNGHATLTVPGMVTDVPLEMNMPRGQPGRYSAIHNPQRTRPRINGDRESSATMTAGKVNPHGEIVDSSFWLTLGYRNLGSGGWPIPHTKMEIRWDPKPATP